MTEQAKHTPGPWTLVAPGVGYNFTEVLAPGHGVVCEIGDWSANHTANARLIAAAPEMYEELKSLMEDRRIALGSTRRKRIAAIIAEAEGRS